MEDDQHELLSLFSIQSDISMLSDHRQLATHMDATNWTVSATRTRFHRSFLLLDELARGAYGFVYRCMHKQTKKLYAVKMNIDPMDIVDHEKEYIVLRRICQTHAHPNIINAFASIVDDMIVYNVYELATGGDLHSFLKRRYNCHNLKDHYKESSIMHQLMSAMAYIHSRGYLHRDIKPQNILILRNETHIHIKVSDFGLAVERKVSPDGFSDSDDGDGIDNGQQFVRSKHGNAGTDRYMSPEVAEDLQYDYECDTWSCGVVLYELLCGRLPFENNPTLSKPVVLTFPMPEWRGLDSAINLIKQLFDRSNRRSPITCEQTLKHPFFERQHNRAPPIRPDKTNAMAHYILMNCLKSEFSQLLSPFTHSW